MEARPRVLRSFVPDHAFCDANAGQNLLNVEKVGL